MTTLNANRDHRDHLTALITRYVGKPSLIQRQWDARAAFLADLNLGVPFAIAAARYDDATGNAGTITKGASK